MARSFLSRTFEIVGAKPLGRNQKARPRRLQPGVDGLESRNLLTGGVSLGSNGMLTIAAPLNSGNTASVSIDSAHNAVSVTLNGSTQEFPVSQVSSIYYEGGSGGGDTFDNETNIMGIEYGWGGNNSFTAGTGQDYMFLWGSGNTVSNSGGFAVAFTHGGQDNIDNSVLTFS